jgi:DNA-binding response OmpR family regulator
MSTETNDVREGASAETPLVLVIEDDNAIRLGLRKSLTFDGFRVLDAADGEAGLELAFSSRPDLIVLDLMLPKLNGFEVCRTIRKHDRTTPILILSAKDQEMDKLVGFDQGADDYITKPFSVRELVARIKAALRRSQPEEAAPAVYEFGRIRVDVPGQTLMVDDVEVEVSNREFRLLCYLIDNRGRVLSRDQILNKVWGYDYEGTARTIDNFINKLRTKIEISPTEPTLIQTVRGVGYKFFDGVAE